MASELTRHEFIGQLVDSLLSQRSRRLGPPDLKTLPLVCGLGEIGFLQGPSTHTRPKARVQSRALQVWEAIYCPGYMQL